MSLRENETVREVEQITVLGHEIRNGTITPYKGILQPLIKMAQSKSNKELKWILGMFVYYMKWIASLSTKI